MVIIAVVGCTNEPISPNASVSIIGSASETSDTFEIKTTEWTIEWSYISGRFSKYPWFSFVVYPDSESAPYTKAILSKGKASGIAYISAPPGNYYIKVYAANLESWSLAIISP